MSRSLADILYSVEGSGPAPGLYGRTQMTKKQMHDEVEKRYTGSGKTRGGFLMDILGTVGNMIKNGVEGKRWSDNTAFHGLGKSSKPKAKRTQTPKQKKRNALVKQVMKKGNMTLGQANQFIKANNLWKG